MIDNIDCDYSICCNGCGKLLTYCNEDLYNSDSNYFQCLDCAKKKGRCTSPQ